MYKLSDGDRVFVDGTQGLFQVCIGEEEWRARVAAIPDLSENQQRMGRELFQGMRLQVNGAEQGAMTFAFERS